MGIADILLQRAGMYGAGRLFRNSLGLIDLVVNCIGGVMLAGFVGPMLRVEPGYSDQLLQMAAKHATRRAEWLSMWRGHIAKEKRQERKIQVLRKAKEQSQQLAAAAVIGAVAPPRVSPSDKS